MVVPLKRRVTLQRARKGASRMGFDALARTTLLRALRMRYGHSTRRASRWRRDRIRARASETRLMRIAETGSSHNSVMTVVLAIPMPAATIVVTVWAVILSFVTINIEQPVPTQIKVMAIMAAQIPATKIDISP